MRSGGSRPRRFRSWRCRSSRSSRCRRRRRRSRSPWRLAAYVLIPFLVFAISYASSAHITQWVDLFHRGESIGPASDYLRGKTPYIDVFPLHGMLEDGLADAWLMERKDVDVRR